MAPPAIRPAGEADVPALARLHLDSYRAAYTGLVPVDFLAGIEVEERERRWRDSVRDHARTTFLAEDGERRTAALFGFAEIGPCRDADMAGGTGELMALHVRRSCWGCGIGRTLHAHALRALEALGCTRATLWVLTGNTRARAFYAAMGWAAGDRVRRHAVRGGDVPEIRYTIELRR